jgi:hypothetical protein
MDESERQDVKMCILFAPFTFRPAANSADRAFRGVAHVMVLTCLCSSFQRQGA